MKERLLSLDKQARMMEEMKEQLVRESRTLAAPQCPASLASPFAPCSHPCWQGERGRPSISECGNGGEMMWWNFKDTLHTHPSSKAGWALRAFRQLLHAPRMTEWHFHRGHLKP